MAVENKRERGTAANQTAPKRASINSIKSLSNWRGLGAVETVPLIDHSIMCNKRGFITLYTASNAYTN